MTLEENFRANLNSTLRGLIVWNLWMLQPTSIPTEYYLPTIAITKYIRGMLFLLLSPRKKFGCIASWVSFGLELRNEFCEPLPAFDLPQTTRSWIRRLLARASAIQFSCWNLRDSYRPGHSAEQYSVFPAVNTEVNTKLRVHCRERRRRRRRN